MANVDISVSVGRVATFESNNEDLTEGTDEEREKDKRAEQRQGQRHRKKELYK